MSEMKRDLWLVELASHKSLQEVASAKIPMGFKPDTALEACVDRQIPISRAIWFIKCVGSQDMVILFHSERKQV
jgi:mediator of RNA polymerase II transcription subunit 12, fungi type